MTCIKQLTAKWTVADEPAGRASKAASAGHRGGLVAVLASIAVFSGVFGLNGSQSAAQTDDSAFCRLYFGLQPPASRSAEREIALIEELLEADRFSESALLVTRRFASDEDHVDAAGESMKRRLLRSLMRCDPAGLRTLETVLRGEYEKALTANPSIAELRTIVSRYPPELFGTAALVALARAQSDQGHYESAADTLRLAAEVERSEGHRVVAERLATQEAIQRLRIGEHESVRWLAGEESSRFIEATASTANAEAEKRLPRAWLGMGGDAKRRAAAPGDLPTPWRSWRATFKTDNPFDSQGSHESGTPSPNLPAGQAIAAAGVIVTPTRHGLVACSADSGRRLWTVSDTAADSEQPLSPARGSLTTDSRLLFAIMTSKRSFADNGVDPSASATSAFFSTSPTSTLTNRLAAYELATGGKLRWQLDGADRASPVAGSRFVGAPAQLDSHLYALAERDQAIVLFEIDAETGRVDWTQTLAHLERETARRDLQPAVTPTISDGVVYCPTGLGALVAVEPLRRRIAWINYLGVDADESSLPQGRAWRGGGRFNPRDWSDPNEGWQHCRAIIDEGRLIVASPAEPTLQAFDSVTGTRLWRREVDGGVALGSVTEGVAVVVETASVSAWRTADGDKAWSVPLPAGSESIGEGILLEDRMLVPLSSGRLAAVTFDGPHAAALEVIDLATNRLAAPPAMGNLLYHRGTILSRAAGSLESYPQRTEAPSAGNAAVEALAASDPETAIRLLREALKVQPSNRRLSEQLAAALIRSVEKNPDRARGVGREIPGLVSGSKAAAYVAMLNLRAVRDTDVSTIEQAARSLATGPAARVVLRPEQGLQVLASRFAEGRLRMADPALDSSAAGASEEGSARFDLAWARQQVAIEIDTEPKPAGTGRKRRTRSDRRSKPRQLALAANAPGRDLPTRWTIETSNNSAAVLVGTNPRGERVFARELLGDLTTQGKGKPTAVGLPGHQGWGERVVVKLDSGYAVYNFAAAAAGGSQSLWTTEDAVPTSGFDGLSGSYASETPVAIGPWGVVAFAGSSLVCRDLDTGIPQWRRALPKENKLSARLLAHEDKLYLADDSERCWRYSAWTGEQRSESCSLPSTKTWRAASGGRLLVESRDVGGRRFQILDITVPGPDQVLWERKAPSSTRFLHAEGLAAFLSEDLQLTVVDIANASERFSVSLQGPAEPLVRAFRLTQRGNLLLVEVDRSNPMVDRARGETSPGTKPLLTGELHCLDATSGQSLWSSPAEIDGLAVLATSATRAPLVLLGNRRAADTEDDQAEASLGLVVLDLASGGTLYRNASLPAGDERSTSATIWDQYESTPTGHRLVIRAGRSWVSLETTSEPAPPRVPMVARIETPRPSDLKDMGRNVELFFKSFLNDEE